MKTRTHNAACPQQYLTAFGLNPDRVIYFDIETTGFRASTSSLYMIGWAVSEESGCLNEDALNANCAHTVAETYSCEWVITQIMAQSRAEEILLLGHFANVLKQYDTIVEFNGDRFDLPYMREKYAEYGMEDPFSDLETVDLYQEIRPFKNALGLTKLNQKSVEQFLRIHREDPYNGGELIDVYRSVRDGRCADVEGALDALFLHNYEDVLGMLDMTPLLAYRLALQSSAQVCVRVAGSEKSSRPAVCSSQDDGSLPAVQNTSFRFEVSFPLDVPVPVPLNFSPGDYCDISLSGDLATVMIHPFSGCLYHFFPDWQNYYYLPEEDTAMHKSVASFVDPSHREKAKAQTCYVKKGGVFLPHGGSYSQTPSYFDSEKTVSPVFQRCYKDSVLWFEYWQGMEEDTAIFTEYVHDLIRKALNINLH